MFYASLLTSFTCSWTSSLTSSVTTFSYFLQNAETAFSIESFIFYLSVLVGILKKLLPSFFITVAIAYSSRSSAYSLALSSSLSSMLEGSSWSSLSSWPSLSSSYPSFSSLLIIGCINSVPVYSIREVTFFYLSKLRILFLFRGKMAFFVWILLNLASSSY